MKLNINSKWNKYTVIVSYVILLIILVSSLLFLYGNLLKYSEKKTQGEDFSELLLISKTISKLYEVETFQNLINADRANVYFRRYDSILPQINQNLNTLKSNTSSADRKVNLDSISLLLAEKQENLRSINILLDSLKSPQIIRNSEYYSSSKLRDNVNNYIKNKNSEFNDRFTEDTIKISSKKKSLRERIKNVFKPTEKDSFVVFKFKPFIESDSFKYVIDTVINTVRHTEKLNFDKQMSAGEKINLRQLALLHMNAQLTSEIDNILKKIEQEEIKKSIELIDFKNKVINSSQQAVQYVSGFASIIILLFGILYFRDFNRKQRYRKDLETSNAHIQQLLQDRQQLMLTISHDVKAPMSSILGYIELMDSNITEEKKKTFLENMRTSGEHIIQLVMNLLDFHKLQSGSWINKKIAFQLEEIVQHTANSFKPLALQKNLHFDSNIDISSDLVVISDPFVFRQIMTNLISNAIKFTKKGNVNISAFVEDFEDKAMLNFKVTDTGVGIDSKDLENIFKEFKRVEDSTEIIEGSGLGLAITKKLVEELGGTINVVSEVYKGSEFAIKIPFQISKLQKVEHFENQMKKDADYDFSGIKVLLVDDDEVQLAMTSEMIRRKNGIVVTETNPENVLSILTKQRFDIIFTDIQMPRLNGFALANMIKLSEIEGTRDVPIIALSAKSDISNIEASEIGFATFIVKPFSAKELYYTIEKFINKTVRKVVPKNSDEKTSGVGALIDFVKDDKEVSKEILQSFSKDLSENISKLKFAHDEDNTQMLSQISHKMLPLFKMINHDDVIIILKDLEERKTVTDAEYSSLFVQLQKTLDETNTMINGL